ANLRSQCVSAVDHLEQFVRSVNRQLFDNTEAHAYATLFFSVFHAETGHLRYANCGHLPAIVLRADGALERLDAPCSVVGLFNDWECSVMETVLKQGDVVALYSDGVTESFNAEGEEFGEDRLVAALRRNCRSTAQELANSIVEEVLAFGGAHQHDDITFIV